MFQYLSAKGLCSFELLFSLLVSILYALSYNIVCKEHNRFLHDRKYFFQYSVYFSKYGIPVKNYRHNSAKYNFSNYNNNNNIYLLQLGFHPVAVFILHVYETRNWLLLNLSRESYMRSMYSDTLANE